MMQIRTTGKLLALVMALPPDLTVEQKLALVSSSTVDAGLISTCRRLPLFQEDRLLTVHCGDQPAFGRELGS